MTNTTPATAEHKRPNYILIWLYLFVLTVIMCIVSAISAIMQVTRIDPAMVFTR